MDTNKHILVVDDEINLLRSVEFILTMAGFKVTKTVSAKEALGIILTQSNKESPIDLLITDIQMPEMLGNELLRKVREINKSLPVLVMTAFGDKSLLMELITLGCSDYIDKPFEPQAFMKRIEEIFSKEEDKRQQEDKQKKKLEIQNVRLQRDLEKYSKIFTNLYQEVDLAKLAYNSLIDIKYDSCRINVAYKLKALSDMGGDFFDIKNTKNGYDILLADVAGHDISAAFHSLLIKSFFDQNANTNNDGISFFRVLNQYLVQNSNNDRMITMVFIKLNLDTMTAEITSAGHPPIIRSHKDSEHQTQPLILEGDILGINEEISFEKRIIPLNPGDRLFLYTDGITNTFYIDGLTGDRVRFSELALINLINKHKSVNLKDAVDSVWQAILEFCKYKARDDMSLIGIEIPKTK